MCPAAPQIWRFNLDAYVGTEMAWLDRAERARAESFVFARDKHRYVAGRCLLRNVLGQRLNLDPHEVVLRLTSHGKPYLVEPPGKFMPPVRPPPLHFNISHSHEICYLAVSEGDEIGIDVELDRAIDDPVALGRTVFSAQEMQQLMDAQPTARIGAFLRGWTRKESLVKAIGIGIGIDLKAITVGLDEQEVIVPPIPDISEQVWRVRSLAASAGEYAAITLPYYPS